MLISKYIPILKIVVHKADTHDTIFLFTGIKFPDGSGFLQIQIPCPKGEGEHWVNKELGQVADEVVLQGFEVVAPI